MKNNDELIASVNVLPLSDSNNVIESASDFLRLLAQLAVDVRALESIAKETLPLDRIAEFRDGKCHSGEKLVDHKLKLELGRYFGRRIFRGVRDSRWHPEASLFRYMLKGELVVEPNDLTFPDCRERFEFSGVAPGAFRDAEEAILISFLRSADRSGSAVPQLPDTWLQRAQGMRVDARLVKGAHESFFADRAREDRSVATHGPEYQLAALAQHHGLPTRLLDWTWNANTAAYFAAASAVSYINDVASGSGAMERQLNKGQQVTRADRHGQQRASMTNFLASQLMNVGMETLSVYVLPADGLLNDEVIDDYRLLESHHAYSQRASHQLRLVQIPYRDNANLRAQEGVFTVLNPKVPFDGDGKNFPICLRCHLSYAFERLGEIEWDHSQQLPPFLVDVRLPLREAPRLLLELQRLGVVASKLFPGMDGVAKEVADFQAAKAAERLFQEAEWIIDPEGSQDPYDVSYDLSHYSVKTVAG